VLTSLKGPAFCWRMGASVVAARRQLRLLIDGNSKVVLNWQGPSLQVMVDDDSVIDERAAVSTMNMARPGISHIELATRSYWMKAHNRFLAERQNARHPAA